LQVLLFSTLWGIPFPAGGMAFPFFIFKWRTLMKFFVQKTVRFLLNLFWNLLLNLCFATLQSTWIKSILPVRLIQKFDESLYLHLTLSDRYKPLARSIGALEFAWRNNQKIIPTRILKVRRVRKLIKPMNHRVFKHKARAIGALC
jgi:hypothetical protein